MPTSRPTGWTGGRASLAVVLALVVVAALPAASFADSPARERELVCSDGSTFVGEQVRHGAGRPPSAWRSVGPGPTRVFAFHATTITAPDGLVVEALTYDHSAGVDRAHDLVTCGFVIPVGPLAGHRADFTGFFVG